MDQSGARDVKMRQNFDFATVKYYKILKMYTFTFLTTRSIVYITPTLSSMIIKPIKTKQHPVQCKENFKTSTRVIN